MKTPASAADHVTSSRDPYAESQDNNRWIPHHITIAQSTNPVSSILIDVCVTTTDSSGKVDEKALKVDYCKLGIHGLILSADNVGPCVYRALDKIQGFCQSNRRRMQYVH